jgi:signal transduction histidine kinase
LSAALATQESLRGRLQSCAEAIVRHLDAFYTTKTGGMGIGLSVSRSIIESHRRCLWAEANDGPGASLHLVCPANGGLNGSQGRASSKLTVGH